MNTLYAILPAGDFVTSFQNNIIKSKVSLLIGWFCVRLLT